MVLRERLYEARCSRNDRKQATRRDLLPAPRVDRWTVQRALRSPNRGHHQPQRRGSSGGSINSEAPVVAEQVHELEEALSAAMIALEISRRNSRVAALQKRWDRLRSGLDLILQKRRADMADLPGGASGLLYRDYKGRRADRLVVRIAPGVVSLVAELRRPRAPGGRGTGPVEDAQRLAGGDQPDAPADRRGVGLVGEGRWRWS